MHHEVDVWIAGKCGSGKSTILAMVAKALQEAGLTVVVDTDDVDDLRIRDSQNGASALAGRIEVYLRTQTTQRHPR